MDSNIEVTPPDLKFRFQINKQLLATITINNKHDQKVAFKIKTTAPKKYVVRPSSGIVDARTSLSVQVIMQAQKDYPDFQNCKDKFMVQTTPLEGEEQLDKDTFNKDVRKNLVEARLRVVMEGPPAPPSPVPEANEADGELTAATLAEHTRAPVNTTSPVTAALRPEVGSDATKLKAQLDALSKERDELRKKLDYVELQNGTTGVTQKVSSKPLDPAVRFRVNIIHIILAAIVAFLLGHYL